MKTPTPIEVKAGAVEPHRDHTIGLRALDLLLVAAVAVLVALVVGSVK